MDKLVYIAASGASRLEQAQAVHAHNLANVGTEGYRREYVQALTHQVHGQGHQARAYGVLDSPGFDLAPGIFKETGRNMDVAVQGDGFLTVLQPDGREGFTRNGALQVDQFGRLVTKDGMQVLGGSGPIALPPFEQIVIAGDGGITLQPAGQGPDALIQVDILKLVNPSADEITKTPLGPFVRKDGEIEQFDPGVRVATGVIETSNVSAVAEMIDILSIAREFELSVRLMRTAEENDESAASLLRVG